MGKPGSLRRAVRRASVALGFVLGAYAVVSIATYAVYSVKVSHRLAEMRRAGEPVTLADLKPRDLPAAQNAAGDYERLFALRSGGPMAVGQLTREQRDLFAAWYPTSAHCAQVLDASRTPGVRQTLAALERVTAKPHWVPAWDADSPELIRSFAMFREVARMCASLARAHGQAGDMDQAATCLIAGLRVARHLTEGRSVMTHLVASAMYQMLGQAGDDVLQAGDIPPPAAQQLAAQLRDGGLAEGMRLGLMGERARNLTEFEHCARDPRYGYQFAVAMARLTDMPTWAAGIAGLNPAYWRRQEWVLLCRTERLLSAVQSPAEAIAIGRRHDQIGLLPPGQAVPRSWNCADFMGVYGFAVSHLHMRRAELDLLATALALRAYHSTHGDYPASLRATGWELPTDPFSGRDFVYRRSGAGFILYSVGANGQDDGGTPPRSFGQWLDEGDLVWPDPLRHR